MYILAQGQCEVLVKDQQYKKDVFVRDLNPGTLFGEIGLVYGVKRTASVRSKKQCTVGSINEEVFLDMIDNFPEMQNRLKSVTRRYDDHWKKYQIHVLSGVDYLHSIPFKAREELHYRMTVENFEKDSKVFTRGTECNQIAFVVTGDLDLIVE